MEVIKFVPPTCVIVPLPFSTLLPTLPLVEEKEKMSGPQNLFGQFSLNYFLGLGPMCKN